MPSLLPLEPHQEIRNYKIISLFAREVSFLMRADRVRELVFNFFRDHLGCGPLAMVFFRNGLPENPLYLPENGTAPLDERLREMILLQAQASKTIQRFPWTQPSDGGSGARESVSLLMVSMDEPVGAIVVLDPGPFKRAIEEPAGSHLLGLVLRHAAEALKGCSNLEGIYEKALSQNFAQEKTRLLRLNEKLERATRAKSEFFAKMSHEMRTPLNVILGLLDSMIEHPRSQEEADLIVVMKNAGITLLGLINDVLDFSKIEAEKLKLDPQPLDLYEFIAATTALFQEKAREKGIMLDFKIEPDVPVHVLADSLRLKQVLFNLLSNALKFTSVGTVHVWVRRGQEKHVVFEILDTGIGLTEPQMQRIFEPFVQADEGTTRTYGGTGLGLSIAQKLVNLMGGNIFVRRNSKDGVGSVFFFDCQLPACLVPARKALSEDCASIAELMARKLRILVVDDSADNRLVVKVILRQANYELVFAADGKEALEKFISGGFDLVFMDMQMPVMSGEESTRRMRDLEKAQNLKRTPIVAFTADVVQEHAKEMLACGCDDVLTKPVVKARIFEQIARWTRNGSIAGIAAQGS